jgi:cyanophycinase
VPVTDIDGPAELREGHGFRSWRRGGPVADRAGAVGGVLLEGGADDVEEAWRWLLARAGHGDIVVLHAAPDEGYDEWISALAPVRSFLTLQLTDRAAADDPFVIASIERADGLFIAGGDQFDYLRVWTDTPIQRAINEAIEAGVPIGGISAGLAVLGEYAFTAERDTVTSTQALADPFEDRVRLGRGFLAVPGLEATITDSHLSERDRLGRLLVFMARTITNGWATRVRAIGIDERTAVLLEPDGSATVAGDGAAWFLGMGVADVAECTAGRGLEVHPIEAVAVRRGATFDMRSWRGDGERHVVAAANGSLIHR